MHQMHEVSILSRVGARAAAGTPLSLLLVLAVTACGDEGR